jgi:carboxypeptidase D
MHFAVSAIALLVASTTLALESPHRKAVRPIKVDHGHLETRAVTVADDGGYKYLNKKTQRTFPLPTGLPGLMIVRISRKWHGHSRGGLRRG